eukprot:TRINITY_DN18832_c0_g1_i1.p1 TRINITY_DN18832_c0_g1~~TRINITY_DN18832_c0_g1_i1.p1  ORF type:complete len:239 (+),score=-24.58 TRINITY_DN18832_c0_g1_i1:96-812(+)
MFSLIILVPPTSTLSSSSAASDVYERQELFALSSEDPYAHGVESGYPHVIADSSDQADNPLFHFFCRFVRKGDGQDVPRVDRFFFQQIGHSVSQHTRFAAACPRHDQQRAFRRQNGFRLPWVHSFYKVVFLLHNCHPFFCCLCFGVCMGMFFFSLVSRRWFSLIDSDLHHGLVYHFRAWLSMNPLIFQIVFNPCSPMCGSGSFHPIMPSKIKILSLNHLLDSVAGLSFYFGLLCQYVV